MLDKLFSVKSIIGVILFLLISNIGLNLLKNNFAIEQTRYLVRTLNIWEKENLPYSEINNKYHIEEKLNELKNRELLFSNISVILNIINGIGIFYIIVCGFYFIVKKIKTTRYFEK